MQLIQQFIKKLWIWFGLGVALLVLTHGAVVLASATPLQLVDTPVSNQTLGYDEQLWSSPEIPNGDRSRLLEAIDHSIRYLQTNTAARAYGRNPNGISRDRVLASVRRFRELVEISRTPEELQAAVKREFDWYKSVGRDQRGTVQYTAYFEPIYEASLTPSEEYRYPLYRLPPNLNQVSHLGRLEIEGRDGTGRGGPLQGLEIAWLRDRMQAFLVHIQGSARLRLPDGQIISIGYAGKSNHNYVSIGRELVRDNRLPAEGLNLPIMLNFFRQNPELLSEYLPRNRSYVYFRPTNGAPATGSLGVPVTAERSIATDKTLMPPGALAVIYTQVPYAKGNGQIEKRLVSRFVLDQDTGGAIIGPGRVDYFLGTGDVAGDRAGRVTDTGELYYLLLRN